LAALNILCAGGILLGPARGEGKRPVVEFRMKDLPGGFRLGVTLVFTGFLGIGYEVLAVRVMAQALENTIYSFASALSVYLLGTALGGALYQVLARRFGGRQLLSWLFPATSTFCLLGILTLASADRTYESLRGFLGGGNPGSIGAEMILALLVFLLPSIAMGATFSHLAQSSRRAGGGVGRALSLNTLGGAFAPLVFGVLLLPHLGSRLAVLLVGLAYLAMLPDRRPRRIAPAVIPLILIPLLPGRFDLVQPPPGGRILDSREGIVATVAVVEESDGNKLLKVNNRFRMGGTRGAFGERRMGHIPLLLHPEPQSALFLGLGTAITFGASADHPGLSADGVELVPEVVGMLSYFSEANRDPQSRDGLRIFVADARRFVHASERDYDVIVADLFHPARDGSGSLYTKEHFSAIRERLSPGGVFCQWLPLYQLDLDLLRLMTRTFLEVFPSTNAFLAHFNAETPALGLVAGREERTYPPDWLEQRVMGRRQSGILQRDGLGGAFSLFACYVAGPQELGEFAGAGPVNSDDRPRVTFEAPRVAYGDPAPPFAVLSELLETLHPSVDELIQGAHPEFEERVTRCIEARNIYLQGDMLRVAGREDEAVDFYVRSATTSPDFNTGYAISLVFARNLLRTDPEKARRILEALNESNPAKPEAGRVLREAFGEAPP
jgi:spermidine synthase